MDDLSCYQHRAMMAQMSRDAAPLVASNLGELFVSAVERTPERTCVHLRRGDSDDRVTYAELARRVASIVRAFDARGIRHGQRLVCFLDDVYDAIHVAIACAHTGVVAVPLDPRSSSAAVRRLIERTDAVAVFTRSEHLERIADIAVPKVTLPELVGDPPADPLALLRARCPDVSSLYVIQPTSGTTGEPKLMLRTQRPFLRIGRVWHFPQIAETPQRHIMVNPLTHGAGFLNLWAGISVLAELCLPSRPNVDAPLAEVRAL